MKRRDVIASLAACSLLASCGGSETGTPPYRYKLKVEVETPEGIRTGESVIQVQWWQGSKEAFGTQASAGYAVVGEAVAVDLPNGQTLFVLLRSPSQVDWAAWAFRGIVPDVKDPRGVGNGKHAVPRTVKISNGEIENFPYFVRFRELNDPNSIELINPDSLSSSFGRGYNLKSVYIQLTDEAVSSGIEKRLVWLKGMRGPLDGRDVMEVNGNLASIIGSGDFKRARD